MLPLNELYNMDCMDGMKQFPDGYFDLAIVDPPYGLERFKHGGSVINKYGDETGQWNNTKPTEQYFSELFRVSKHQIIWGATTLLYRKANTLSFGIKSILRISALRNAKWHGRIVKYPQRYSHITAQKKARAEYIRRRSLLLYTNGCCQNTQKRATKY